MEQINTIKGETYLYDEETDRIFKDGKLIPSTLAEAIFTNIDSFPQFSGIYLKETGQVISKSGNINTMIDSNSVQ